MILEHLEIDLLKPWLEEPGLPEPRQMIRRICPIQVFVHGVLGVGGIRRDRRPQPADRG